MQVTYRTGLREECPRLAGLMYEASAGVADFLYDGLVPGSTPVAILARGLAADRHPQSYKDMVVAEAGGRVAGLALAYPAHLHGITPEMRGFFPGERLEHLRPLYEMRVEDSWFLDAMSVDADFRRRRIGSALIEETKKEARENGYDVVSLQVSADNEPAVHLYRRSGFEVVDEVQLDPSPWFLYRGASLLMKASLNA